MWNELDKQTNRARQGTHLLFSASFRINSAKVRDEEGGESKVKRDACFRSSILDCRWGCISLSLEPVRHFGYASIHPYSHSIRPSGCPPPWRVGGGKGHVVLLRITGNFTACGQGIGSGSIHITHPPSLGDHRIRQMSSLPAHCTLTTSPSRPERLVAFGGRFSMSSNLLWILILIPLSSGIHQASVVTHGFNHGFIRPELLVQIFECRPLPLKLFG